MVTAQEGMKIKLNYTGKLEDGEVFDSSEGKDPLEFIIGQGHIIKGFEEAVIGMSVGEEKDIIITPEKGYGEPKAELIQNIPKDKLGELKPEVGMVVGMQIPGVEQVFPAKITEVKEDSVTVDLNPPLAGKTLKFHIKLEEIEENPVTTPTEEKPKTEEKPTQEPAKEEEKVSEEKTEEQKTETPTEEKSKEE